MWTFGNFWHSAISIKSFTYKQIRIVSRASFADGVGRQVVHCAQLDNARAHKEAIFDVEFGYVFVHNALIGNEGRRRLMGEYSSTAEPREATLRAFLANLKSLDVAHDKDFQSALANAQRLLELSDGAMADALLVSRPTVNRWVRGRNLPHRALRRPVISWIETQLTQRIKTLDTQATRSGGGRWSAGMPLAAKG